MPQFEPDETELVELGASGPMSGFATTLQRSIALGQSDEPPDIFNVLKLKNAKDTIDRKRTSASRSREGLPGRREFTFTCEELKNEISRVNLQVLAGKRERPTRGGLLRELGNLFGIKNPRTGAVEQALRGGRCAHLLQNFLASSVEGRTAEGHRRATFSCDQLKSAMELAAAEGNPSRNNVTRILSKLADYEVPVLRVTQAIGKHGRCSHLRKFQSERGARPMPFECSELEEVIRSGIWNMEEISKAISSKKGKPINREAVQSSLRNRSGNRSSRCAHLELLRKEMKARRAGTRIPGALSGFGRPSLWNWERLGR